MAKAISQGVGNLSGGAICLSRCRLTNIPSSSATITSIWEPTLSNWVPKTSAMNPLPRSLTRRGVLQTLDIDASVHGVNSQNTNSPLCKPRDSYCQASVHRVKSRPRSIYPPRHPSTGLTPPHFQQATNHHTRHQDECQLQFSRRTSDVQRHSSGWTTASIFAPETRQDDVAWSRRVNP
jgi:hypothetical protein